MNETSLIPEQRIQNIILSIRGEKVILDSDLAELYGVETKTLNRAVKRNKERFPQDFMFQLSNEEFTQLKKLADDSTSWGGRRKAAFAFTEQGVAMASGVLQSRRAIEVNIQIMRTFVKLRSLMQDYSQLKQKLVSLENKICSQDENIKRIFLAIQQMMPPKGTPKKIGFNLDKS